jgi:predicted HTH transcriptional regulator
MNDASEIVLNRIKKGEGQHLDFKHSINDSRKIARSLSAFSNTDGGLLLIGVRDNGSIKGIKSDEEFYMVETAAHIFCKPEIQFEHKLWLVEGKNVLEIIVPEGDNKPYLAPDEKGDYKAFIRNEDQNLVADKIIRDTWKRKQKGLNGIKIIYDHKIECLLNHIDINGHITKSEFMKTCNLKSNIAGTIITNFLLMELLEYRLSEKETCFVFSDKFIENENDIISKLQNKE